MITGLIAKPDPQAVAELVQKLCGDYGERAVTSQSVREHHSHGESYHVPAPPDLVCFPRTTQEVSAIMKISARHKIPVVPYGAGTSVEGNVNAIRGGIAIDLREMNKVTRISVIDFLATVGQTLGLDVNKTNQSNVGQPIRLVDVGARPLKEVL